MNCSRCNGTMGSFVWIHPDNKLPVHQFRDECGDPRHPGRYLTADEFYSDPSQETYVRE